MEPELKTTTAHTSSRRGLNAAVTLTVVAILVGGGWLGYQHFRVSSPVPANVRSSVPFPVYYPDAKKLPAGFTFDPTAITATNQVIVYTIKYTTGKQLAITEQVKPTDDQLKDFATKQLPLNTTVAIPAGTATIGAIGMQTVISLPTHDNTWLLITGPSSIKPAELKQFLQSLRK